MDFVALTNHETLDDGRGFRSRCEFMLGVKVNARFRDDNSTVDILIYGPSDDDHREIQNRRSDVYALLDYHHEANVIHVLAHPLFDLGHLMRRADLEERMVLFNLWE